MKISWPEQAGETWGKSKQRLGQMSKALLVGGVDAPGELAALVGQGLGQTEQQRGRVLRRLRLDEEGLLSERKGKEAENTDLDVVP